MYIEHFNSKPSYYYYDRVSQPQYPGHIIADISLVYGFACVFAAASIHLVPQSRAERVWHASFAPRKLIMMAA